MKILTVTLTALLLAPPLLAQEVKVLGETATFTFEPPTTRRNGEPLPYEEIGKYDLNCAGKTTWLSAEEGKDGKYVTKSADILPEYGEYICKIAVVDTEGRRSYWSDDVPVKWPEPAFVTPMAPTGIGTE